MNQNSHKIEGYMHMVSYQNTDLLKAEVAHHNPKGLVVIKRLLCNGVSDTG